MIEPYSHPGFHAYIYTPKNIVAIMGYDLCLDSKVIIMFGKDRPGNIIYKKTLDEICPATSEIIYKYERKIREFCNPLECDIYEYALYLNMLKSATKEIFFRAFIQFLENER